MRAAFVVGLDGRIAYAWSHEDGSNQVDFAAIQAAVQSCVALLSPLESEIAR